MLAGMPHSRVRIGALFPTVLAVTTLAACAGGMNDQRDAAVDSSNRDTAASDAPAEASADAAFDGMAPADVPEMDTITIDDVPSATDSGGTDARTDSGSRTDAGRTDAGNPGDGGANVSSILVPRNGAWFGAMSNPLSGENQGSAIARFEMSAQRTLDIAHAYHSGNQTFPNSTEQAWSNGGRMLLVNWKPSTTSWRAAADGSLDASVIGPVADRIRAFGRPMFLVLWHEPEDQLDAGFDTAANYVAMWRHVHDVFAAHGVTNVVWVWNMMGYVSHRASWTSMYPGDAYVDWLGADPYTFSSQTFDQSTQSFYDWATANAPSKPIMYCEFGPANQNNSFTPAHEASWIRSIIPSLQTTRSRVRAVVYWDNASPQWQSQTAIDANTTYLTAAREVLHDPFFNQPH